MTILSLSARQILPYVCYSLLIPGVYGVAIIGDSLTLSESVEPKYPAS